MKGEPTYRDSVKLPPPSSGLTPKAIGGVLVILGFACLGYGAWRYSPVAGWCVTGGLLVFIGVAIANARRPESDDDRWLREQTDDAAGRRARP